MILLALSEIDYVSLYFDKQNAQVHFGRRGQTIHRAITFFGIEAQFSIVMPRKHNIYAPLKPRTRVRSPLLTASNLFTLL